MLQESSVEELRRQLAVTQTECIRLRAENEQLRSAEKFEAAKPVAVPLLSLESFPTEPLPKVDVRSSAADKITLFRTLFRGRDDVYPMLWINERTGKKGYSPVVKGGWRHSHDENREYLPLTAGVYQEHLSGEKTIGAYPLLPNDTCWFLACDFDGPDWIDDSESFLSTCKMYGIPAYLERSRSGNGGHVWIFFLRPVLAASARRLGASLLRKTMAARPELSLASYDRFFPNQDFVPKGGFGNLIALPLQKKRRDMGHTEFLDPETGTSWPDQWAFLSSIHRLTQQHLDYLLEKIPPVTVGIESAVTVGKNLCFEASTAHSIYCELRAVLQVEKSGLPSSLLSEIKHLASLHNPIFYERQKLRLSTYKTPRFITCYEHDVENLYLPRGVTEELSMLASSSGCKLVIQDRRRTPKKIALKFHGELSPTQQDAVKAVLEHEQGVLVAPPGAGKTVMGCYVLVVRSVPTLILVHRKPLIDQWRVQLTNLLGLSSKEIGQVGGGRHKPNYKIDLAMIQSLPEIENLGSFFSNYGLIIVDECHHIPAVSFEGVMKRATSRYILGLTATPYRRDGLQDIIHMQCGPIRHKMGTRSGSQDELALQLMNRETDFYFSTTDNTSIQDIFRELVNNGKRSKLICQDIFHSMQEGRKILVLSQRREHCRLLMEQLVSEGKKPFVLDGGVRKKDRLAIIDTIRNLPQEEELVLIATGQYLGEGFDCPQLDTLFLVFPVAFKGKLIQYTGRLMRSFKDKRSVQVYDYVDGRMPLFKKMHAKRLKVYKELGFLH